MYVCMCAPACVAVRGGDPPLSVSATAALPAFIVASGGDTEVLLSDGESVTLRHCDALRLSRDTHVRVSESSATALVVSLSPVEESY
jgi:hypothetical protein